MEPSLFADRSKVELWMTRTEQEGEKCGEFGKIICKLGVMVIVSLILRTVTN